MPDLRRRRFASAVWVPLRLSETVWSSGKYPEPGAGEEIIAANAIAFPDAQRATAKGLGWSRLGLAHEGGPYAYSDGRYKPCEVYRHDDHEDTGVDLVFVQSFAGEPETIWHLSQDLILALDLKKEDDAWVRPSEAYVEVARQRRDAEGRVVAIEIRADFLRDYLAARQLALRLSYYRQRMAVLSNVDHIDWHPGGLEDDRPHDRFTARTFEIGADGGLPGGVAIFHVWRTDVDELEDVPVFDQEGEHNTASRSARFERKSQSLWRVEGELWRAEWIEPAPLSERVRGDPPGVVFHYVVDAGGARMSNAELNDEDIGRYLWFRPDVIGALLAKRGAGLRWYTRDTGSVWCSPNNDVHFGVNSSGLVNAYAYDIASLPLSQQQIWAGFNVAPEGGVSAELLASQQRAEPADTTAPEVRLLATFDRLDGAFRHVTGESLFQQHPATDQILTSVHRFRSSDAQSLLSLAKDIARLVADRISLTGLRKLARPPNGEKWGSLKSLEKALATRIGDLDAREILAPLFGVYDMRLGDAHLPSSDKDTGQSRLGIDPAAPWVEQGAQMISSVAEALHDVANAFDQPLQQ